MANASTLSMNLRSPLAAFTRPSQTRAATAQDGLCMSEIPNLGYIILRGHSSDSAFAQATSQVLGAALPTLPSSYVQCPAGVVYWVSPDEWWLITPRAGKDALVAQLTQALQGVFAQVVDNSGGHTALRISGAKHLLLLRHMGVYDFETLQVGQAIGTVMAKANVTVLRTDSQGVVLLFRRSFADYLWRLLSRTGKPYGLCISPLASNTDPVVSPLHP
ncbi:hypothetical protein KIK84_10265 [Curvibacter sp. CHRR-16]|uniref:sarcosine oxidase subunit gamma n=1 Tax=Curvibacter sp. CHRR-16 TaxID=2835872 RepID=UPI001BD9C34A|nr:sarcosine oxidase subunit gamma family protein [Curvibacter sp. CHRR-16]MBT0570714.1 hypothetical protein [Curvibacter sp. CHRR-16]